ncbi:MAG: M1 family metallopeptidase [Humibacillus sp.]|nr:M1 family metallopeptidase [Humibacillus sp.]MDN5775529.1 M1 family metallopeptidase [Humibacillus sp.]
MSSGDPYVPGRGDVAFEVTHYDLDLDYKMSSNRLSGKALLEVVALAPLAKLHLDLAGLRVSKVTVDGDAVKWAHRGERLNVTLRHRLATDERVRVAIAYAGSPAPVRSPWGEVGWEELDDGVLVASQPSGAPTWFPCNDHPRSKATYRIAIECDSPYEVVATGTLTDKRVRGSRTRRVFEQRRPMATYLAAVHAGQYEQVLLADGPVPQRVVLPAAVKAPVLADLERQPRMMSFFAEVFGRYPFDDYTVVVTADELEIPLEAQGMATFGPNWLRGRGAEERLVAHELAHQWFGNSLTISTWSDIWLNEGFACYAEWLWSEASGAVSADALAEGHRSQLAALPQTLVLADPGPRLMFDDRVYKRGALALHALRRQLGDDTFFALVRAWVATYEHGSVSTAGFVDLVVAHDDRPAVHELLDAWLWRTPLPLLPAATHA